MEWIDLTLPSPAENLALDEAWLELAERGELATELLRFWEPPTPFVVLGRASSVHQEVERQVCQQRSIPILRRCSGGGTILALAGCLLYALILRRPAGENWGHIEQVHAQVLDRVRRGLASVGLQVTRRGTSDLVWGDRKVSGNSVRLKRHAVLYHGTLLYGADLDLIAACLQPPPRQPDYRADRSHREFIANLPVARGTLIEGLRTVWGADRPIRDWPVAEVTRLVAEKYSREGWNLER